jgi:hypothetical protein
MITPMRDTASERPVAQLDIFGAEHPVTERREPPARPTCEQGALWSTWELNGWHQLEMDADD